MKFVQISQDILPMGEFKTHASRVLRRLRAAQRPIVITLNGKPAAVLITPEEFDRLYERERFVEAGRMSTRTNAHIPCNRLSACTRQRTRVFSLAHNG